MIKRNIRREFDSIRNELDMNLSNNYKDLAQDALRKLKETVDTYYKDGMLKDKDYSKLKAIVDDYSVKMADYHH